VKNPTSFNICKKKEIQADAMNGGLQHAAHHVHGKAL